MTVVEGFRLSSQQRRLLELAGDRSGLYRAQCVLGVRGKLDHRALGRAVERVVADHEILRTGYHRLPSRTSRVQVIGETAVADHHRVDLRGLEPTAALGVAREVVRREREWPWELESQRPLRVVAVDLGGDEHRLVVGLPALAADSWSLLQLAREIAHAYAGEERGEPVPPTEPMQYADFAEWQAQSAEEEEAAAGIAFWREQELPEAPELPFAGDGGEGFRPRVHLRTVDAEDVERLASWAGERSLSTSTVVLALGAALLSRLAGVHRLPVAVSLDGRSYEELQDLLGPCGRWAPLAVEVAPRDRLEDLVRRLAPALEDLSFWQEHYDPARFPERSDGLPLAFEYTTAPQPVEAGATRFSVLGCHAWTERFDLLLSCLETDGGLEVAVVASPGRVDAAAARAVGEAFSRLFRSVARDPEGPLWSFAPLDDEVRHKVLETLHAGPRPESAGAEPLLAAVERWAGEGPQRTALVQGNESWSYGRLAEETRDLAARLRRCGLRPEDRVGLLVPRSPRLAAALLAVRRVGAAWVALDPEAPEERRTLLLEDSAPDLLVVEGGEVPAGWQGPVLDLGDEGDEGGDGEPVAVPDRRSLAYVSYTSGSTGRPKGVAATWGGVDNYLRFLAHGPFGLSAEDVVLQVANPAFDASVRDLLAPLALGARVVLPPAGDAARPDRLASLVVEAGVTAILSLVPTVLRSLAAAVREPVRDGAGPRLLMVSGEVLRSDDVAAARRAFGDTLRVVNLYGPTETTMTSTWMEVGPVAADGAPLRVGRPIPGVRVHVLDRHLEPLPAGVTGHVYVGGAGVSRGYLGRAAETARRFLPDPFAEEPGSRLYDTGDLGRYRPGGALEFLGRSDRQVKLRGVRIEPGEVEVALRREPGVEGAAVAVRTVEGEELLVAWYVADEERVPPRELRAALERRLPAALVPSVLVPLPALPQTASGKVDWRALPDPAGLAGRRPPHRPPRSAEERELATTWETLLRVERVGLDDHFFELGGHSLLATRLAARVDERFGVRFAIRQVFENPTLESQAARVAELRTAAGGARGPAIVPLPRQPGEEVAASFAQERLWFLDRLEPGSAAYNMPSALRAEGPLDVAVLGRSLTRVVERHEVLRSRLVEVDGQPRQVVDPAPERFPLPLVDLSALAAGVRREEARRLLAAEAVRPFDLERGPLLRSLVLRLALPKRSPASSPAPSPAQHLLFVNMHHAVSDGWSVELLHGELTVLYRDLAAGTGGGLPALPVQYADYAAWQRRLLRDGALEEQLEYWRRQLAAPPDPLPLPVDRPYPAVRRYLGVRVQRALSPDLAQGLEGLARERSASLFMVLATAFLALLHRYTGASDLTLGTVVSGRDRPQLDGLLGFFANTLVLRADAGADPSFGELLAAVRETSLSAFSHQDVPFERLVQEIHPDRSLQHSPLFQVMLVLQNLPRRVEVGVEELTLEHHPLPRGGAKYDLELLVGEGAEGLLLVLEHDREIFDGTTALRLLGHLEILARSTVTDPSLPLSRLALLSAPEVQQLAVEWQGPVRDLPARAAHLAFEARAAATPDAPAVVEGGDTVDYGSLARRVADLAAALSGAGVGRGDRVAVLLPRGAGLLATLLATWRLGAAYVPLDLRQPVDRHLLVLERASPRRIISSGELAEELAGALADLPPERRPPVSHLDALEAEGAAAGAVPPIYPDPDELAYVLFTSGSTGVPKGAMVTHGGMLNHLLAKLEDLQMDHRDGLVQNAPASFDISIWQLVAPLLVGGWVVFADDEEAQDPGRLLRVAASATVLEVVPSLLRVLLDEVEGGAAAVPEGLRWLMATGESLPPAVARRWLRACPSVPLVNAYGPTECSDDVTHALLRRPPAEGAARVELGRALRNTELHVVDGGGRRLPAGVAGELLVGGAGVGRGYLDSPSRTAEVFVPDPFSGRLGARLYRTGDRVRCTAEGAFDFLGRLDFQVKVRGHRIELGEIETVLEGHPAVAIAAVQPWSEGSGGSRLVAYWVTAEGEPALRWPDLAEFLAARLPEYMVPADGVPLERMPLTVSGKVDRKALPEPRRRSSGGAAPRSAVEQELAGIWARLLGVARVSRDDDFFALGGHSLLATQLVSWTRRSFGVEVPLRRLFEQPRLADLAAAVEEGLVGGGEAGPPPLVPADRERPLPLSFAQQRLWFLHRMEPDSSVFNVPLALRLAGPLDPAALAGALADLVERHEVLRTTFCEVDGDPRQVVASPRPVALPCLDLSAFTGTGAENEARRQVAELAARPFDLVAGPVMRAHLLVLGEEDHVLLLAMHHIVSDEWSLGVMVRELPALYRARLRGEPAGLEELPVQYADYAAWQRTWLAGETLQGRLDWWIEHLRGVPDRLELPTDRPRPAQRSLRGGYQSRLLDEATAEGLEERARREGATLFMVLFTAWSVVLHAVTGQRDLVVGTDVANRTAADTEGLIGFFINQLALRVRLPDEDAPFADLLAATRETTLGAYARQDLPFEKLVEVLRPARSRSHAPLFQVKLNLVNVPLPELDLGDLELGPFDTGEKAAELDLILNCRRVEGGLSLRLEYDADLFEPPTAGDLLAAYRAVLERLAEGSPESLRELRRRVEATLEERRRERRADLREDNLDRLMRRRRPAGRPAPVE